MYLKLPIFQCLKTVALYILFSCKVIYSKKASLGNTYSVVSGNFFLLLLFLIILVSKS